MKTISLESSHSTISSYAYIYNSINSEGLQVLGRHILFGVNCLEHPDKHKDGYKFLNAYYEDYTNPSVEDALGDNANFGTKLKNFVIMLYSKFINGIKILIEKAKSVLRLMTGDDLLAFTNKLDKLESGIKFKDTPVLANPPLAKAWSLLLSANSVVTTHEQFTTVLANHSALTKAVSEALKITLKAIESIELDKTTLSSEKTPEDILNSTKEYINNIKECFEPAGKWTHASKDKNKNFSSFKSKSLINGNQLSFVLVEANNNTASSIIAASPSLKSNSEVNASTIETLTLDVYTTSLKTWATIGKDESELRANYSRVLQSEAMLSSKKRLIESELNSIKDDELDDFKAIVTQITVLYSNLFSLSDVLTQHTYRINRMAKNDYLRYIKASKEGKS